MLIARSTVPPKSEASTPPAPAAASGAATPSGAAKEQKITPFDVQGGVDADGKETGMWGDLAIELTTATMTSLPIALELRRLTLLCSSALSV